MDEQWLVDLPATAQAGGLARWALAVHLGTQLSAGMLADAQLVISELDNYVLAGR